MAEQQKTCIRETTIAIVAFYVLALCMNGEALMRNAELMRYGAFRDVMVTVTRPFAAIASRGPGWLRANVAEKRDAFWEGVE